MTDGSGVQSYDDRKLPVVQSPNGDVRVTIGRQCVGDTLDAAAGRWGTRQGWRFGEVDVTFRDMQVRANWTAKALLANGIGQGDVVATLMPNRPEFAFLQFACAKIGAILCPISTRSKSFELEHCLNHSEARVLVMVDRFLKLDFTEILAELVPSSSWRGAGAVESPWVPNLRLVVSIPEAAAPEARSWDSFLGDGDSVSTGALGAVQSQQRWDRPVILQYTSGTTSKPKGALCNHRYVLYFGVEYMLRMGLRENEAFLNTQPFYHNGGSCGAIPVPLSLGCKAVSPDYYEVESVLRLIESERCTVRTGYGAMYVMEMNHPKFREFDLSSLRSGWCVGTRSLMQRVHDEMRLDGLVQIYGATEASGTSGWVDDSWSVRSSTCGSVLTGMEIGIFDPETNERLPAGEVGEIRLRGWLRMNGYHKQPDMTARTIDVDGWVHMGDLGFLDDKSCLHFVGRLKDMLKIGGENVSAEEVETILLTHPDILQVCVIGAPDDRLTEVVMAIIETRPNADLTAEEVISYCRPRMANFRVPRYVRFTKEWPMTDSGKIRKAKLRDLYLWGTVDGTEQGKRNEA